VVCQLQPHAPARHASLTSDPGYIWAWQCTACSGWRPHTMLEFHKVPQLSCLTHPDGRWV